MTNSTGLPLPPNWIAVRLSDVCEINPRLTPDEIPDPDTEVTFVPMAAVDEIQGQIVQPEIRQYREVVKGFTPFLNNDVLFAKITPSMENGKAAIANNLLNGIGFGSTEFHVLRPSEVVLAEWVFAFIRQGSFRANARQNFVGSAGQQRVPVDFLERTYIPPLPEQHRIVAILHQADDLRRERCEIDEQAKQLLPAMFQEMFGDPIRHKAGWEEKSLSDFVDIDSSLVDPKDESYLSYPHVGSDNIDGDTGELISLNTTGEVGSISGKFSFTSEHVLYSKIRPRLRKVATPDFAGLCSADIYPLTLDKDQAKRQFVAQLLRSNHFTAYVERVSGRAQIPKVNRDDLLKFKTVLPDVDSQIEFERRVAEVIATRRSAADTLVEFDKLSGSLLTRAFTGDLTAVWHDAHLEELRQAAEERDRLLAERGRAVVPSSVKPEVVEVAAGPEVTHPRYALLRELSPAQYAVYQAAQKEAGYFTTETLVSSRGLDAEITRETLPLLEAVGLVARVNLVSDESLETDPKQTIHQLRKIAYAPIYRALRSEDDSRNADLQALELAYPEFRQVRNDLEAGKSLST